MRKNFVWGYCLTVMFIASPTFSFSTARTKRSVQSFHALTPGTSTMITVKETIGPPDEISADPEGESWRYNNNGYEQLGAYFNKDTGILEALRWQVGADENEQTLEKSLAHFPDAKWIAEIDEWVHAHIFPDDCYFHAPNLGVTVHYRMHRKEVASISRSIPQKVRQVSDLSRTEAPPKFCWSDDHRSCSNYTPGREWQKKFKTCEPELKRALTAIKK
jgi:hypothetical protein